MSKVVVMDHPLIAHKIGIIRKKETGTREFREMISEIGTLITYEATKDLKRRLLTSQPLVEFSWQPVLGLQPLSLLPHLPY